jgi:hypothetical protein
MRMVLLCTLAFSASAAIVDRVEVAVGNKVITQSDIDLRIRLTAFENQEPADFSLESRRQTAQRLIDQRTIEREMEVGRYPRIGAARLDEMMAGLEKRYPTHDAMAAALAEYQVTETQMREDFARQADLLTFLSLRFRPAGDVSDADSNKRADAELDAWLADQRARTRIEYPDPEIAPEQKK